MIVAMSTYNRPTVTRLCLSQLAETKPKGVILQAWDAGSNEYDPSELYSWGADEVYRANNRVNDGQNRSLQFNHFIRKTDEDLIYLVDNDAYHDPTWHKRLMTLWRKHKATVCLFNGAGHYGITKSPYYSMPHGNIHAETNDVIFSMTAGGISLLLSRDVVLRNHDGNLSTGYDWHTCRWDRHVVTSKRSYVAHINFDGMHTRLHRAGGIELGMNPTNWLKKNATEAIVKDNPYRPTKTRKTQEVAS